jgi:RNA polymerase sigma-70 factor, ECF subfamily
VSSALREPSPALDLESRAWLDALAGTGADRDRAIARLHALLVRGARFELSRRRGTLRGVADREIDDLATQAAADALVAILAKLPTFAGRSRFTTWAYKFVIFEASVKARRRAWEEREVALADREWGSLGPSAQQLLEEAELLAVVRDALRMRLTEHQRTVFIALTLNDVPIDVLAERLGTTRGALYKTLHDARRKLRAALAEAEVTVA